MKKAGFISCIFILSLSFVYGQTDDDMSKKKTQFGVTLSYVSATAKAKVDEASVSSSDSATGVSFGISSNSQISDKFYIQPSVQFAIIEEENWLFVPVMLKYYVEDKFNIMAGPQGTFSFGDKQGLPINTFGLDFGFGAGYDINNNFYLEARYAFELTNRTPDPVDIGLVVDDPSFQSIKMNTKVNSFHFTLGYRFN